VQAPIAWKKEKSYHLCLRGGINKERNPTQEFLGLTKAPKESIATTASFVRLLVCQLLAPSRPYLAGAFCIFISAMNCHSFVSKIKIKIHRNILITNLPLSQC
jgi:hypothetical protein